MKKLFYDWSRFYCLRTGSINLSDNGFMSDPDSEYGSFSNPDVVNFKSISNKHCLILLGQPGIGKSYELKKEYKTVENHLEPDNKALFFDIATYTESFILKEEVFNHEDFRRWLNGEIYLHLFFDSFDECKIFNKSLSDSLIREIKNGPLDKLFLRIACRTAEWSHYLEEQLMYLFTKSGTVGVYELTPLRRKDVSLSAKLNGINEDKFLTEVQEREVVPLAIIPTTLDFLLKTFLESNILPNNKVELYERGCKRLCQEISLRRLDYDLDRYELDKRLTVASRLAVVSIFSNRNKFLNTEDYREVELVESDVCQMSDFYGTESLDGTEFEVGNGIISETLQTALFTSRGKHLMGWVQQTFAEYLAARYIVHYQLAKKQILNLLIHSSDPERKFIPQLYQVTAWIAMMDKEIFREVLDIQPEILLSCDLTGINNNTTKIFVNKILKLIEEDKLRYYDWNLRKSYKKFNYSGLSSLLRSVITNKRSNESLCNAAIDIIEACNITELNNELLSIALNADEKYSLRTNAAHAIVRIGDSSDKEKLKPLAYGLSGEDPDEELKGLGLKAIWPEHLQSSDLFSILTPPRRRSLLGVYRSFYKEILDSLLPNDVQHALSWVLRNDKEHVDSHTVQDLINQILIYSWEHLESNADLFTDILLERIKRYDTNLPDTLNQKIQNDEYKRRFLIIKIVACTEDQGLLTSLRYSRTSLVLDNDFVWLIDEFIAESDVKIKNNLLKVIDLLFRLENPTQSQYLFTIIKQKRELNEFFGNYFTTVNLTDEKSIQARREYYAYKNRLSKRNNEPILLSPSPAERLNKWLDQYEESGDFNSFWQLNLDMTLTDHSTHYGDELEFDLRKLPGWNNSDELTRQRIINAAIKYIKGSDPNTSHWLGTNIYRPAVAGFRAILLLINLNADHEISVDDWKKWASIILAYPTPNGHENELVHQRIIKKAYFFAPLEIRKTLEILIDKESKENNYVFVTRKISECWDDQLFELVLNKASNPRVKPKVLGVLLKDLFINGYSKGGALAEKIIKKTSSSEIMVERKVEAANALMQYSDDAGWNIVWPVLRLNTKLSNKIINRIASYSDENQNFLRNSSEDQLANFYLLLVKRYPYETDPKIDGVHSVSDRESISSWRDSIIRYLKEKGSPAACITLEKISRMLPQYNWIKNYYYEAQTITRMNTWERPEPKDLLRIIKNHKLRYVNSGFDLMNVLKESLERAELRLQGKNPLSFLLWDEISTKVFRPKNENSLSDFLTDHFEMDLKDKGIIVNREVEFTRRVAATPGQRVDILVEAFLRGKADDPVSVVIEVKGNWHPELDTAMKEQLLDRYMKQVKLQHGLYVIGWFASECWDKKDHRRIPANKLTIEQAKKYFLEQSQNLSEGTINIQAALINVGI
ncbi:NACHT domain-containing protein [Paenibacillus naphthalenovorans]|uniref:NACHT domain-containing protein n=1 Tax=Paenibacillus naphthalenovorans TaxID=162209 RepID=UPI003D2E50B3